MKCLGYRQALWIHRRIIEEIGGSFELRDEGLLRSALARPHASFDGRDLYPSLFEKAAALLESLVRNHPFVDGNKRVAWECFDMLLDLNGTRITATDNESYRLIMKIIERQRTVQDIVDWLKRHSRPSR